jgi:hypothetical protein
MKKLITLLILATLYSCNIPIYSFKSTYDKFDNVKKFQLQANNLGQKNVGFIGSHDTYLNAICIAKDSTIIYLLEVNYNADSWLFIDEGESLVMLIDEKRLGFTGKGSSDHRNIYGSSSVSIQEFAYYDITKQQFEQIITGNKIELKLTGQKGYEKFFFTNGNKAAFKKFYDMYVNKTTEEIINIPIKK